MSQVKKKTVRMVKMVKMVRMRRARKRLNNAGMSLVEVIISVTILSIVVVAVLQSLTTAMVYNAKARKRQDTTFKAEAIMEVFKGYNVSELYDMFKGASTGDSDALTKLTGMFGTAGTYQVSGADPKTDPDAALTFDINDIEIKSTDSEAVDLYNIRIAAKPSYREVYAVDKMDSTQDAIFLSDESYDSGAAQKAYDNFNNTAGGFAALLGALKSSIGSHESLCDASGTELSDTDMIRILQAGVSTGNVALTERITTFTINDTDVAVKMKYKYHFEGISFYKKVPVEHESSEGDEGGGSRDDFEVVQQYASYYPSPGECEIDLADSSVSGTSKNLYIYYYPQYDKWNEIDTEGDSSEKTIKDTIEINNQGAGTVECYLFKQKKESISSNTVKIRDASYRANVTNTGGSVNLYHNLGVNVGAEWDDESGTTTSPSITGFDNGGEAYLQSADARKEKALAYTIEIKIWQEDPDHPVSTFTSTANER